MIDIQCFTVGAFQVNTYLITDEATGISAIVDTGESNELVERLLTLPQLPNVQKILLTHGHLDHAGALPSLQTLFPKAETVLPKLEKPLFDTLPVQGDWFSAPHMNRECGRIDLWIEDGETVSIGTIEMRFISTPGHTPGQGCYYNQTDIFVGDTLFAGSIGRTDLPMGNHQLMLDSLERLMQLPAELVVHSGHGPVTSLKQELVNNPFLTFLR
jgi:glyoxylase-like metal-dependent hydrolase (beta-lactamase superfamily II)